MDTEKLDQFLDNATHVVADMWTDEWSKYS